MREASGIVFGVCWQK